MLNNILVIIPARSGSKGLKNKNIKLFNNEPLLLKSVKQAQRLFKNNQILISTDSEEYKKLIEQNTDIKVSELRPKNISKDESTNEQYLFHLIDKIDKNRFKWILLLQVTSPLRQDFHIKEALKLIDNESDMIASVNLSSSNPFYVQRLIDKEGRLIKLFKKNYKNRQACPNVYELNGVLFLINIISLIKYKKTSHNKRIKPYFIEPRSGYDIDNNDDFEIAHMIEKSDYFRLNYLKKN